MSERNKPAKSGTLMREALTWIVRLTSGTATQADAEALHAWRQRSPAHEDAFRAAAALWRRSRGAAQAAEASGAWRVPQGTRLTVPWTRRSLAGGLGAAAGVAGVAIAGSRFGYLPDVGELLADHRTATGEQKRVVLADGSSVELNTRTSLAVRFTAGQRRLELIEGEAIFSVAGDAARPFVVAAGRGTTTATGTRFAVRHLDEAIRVVCLDGSVVIVAGSRARLSAGERAIYDRDGILSLGRVDAAAETAWRSGMLVFRDQPLGQVVTEINRYRRGRVWLAGDAAARRRVSGVFHLDRPDEALAHIERTLGLKATRMPAGLMVLR